MGDFEQETVDKAYDSRDPRHPIGVVSRRTGLKPDLIRAWERRYSAVEPSRSETRRRFYSDQDIERLRLLRDATRGGRSIGQVAQLSDEELVALIAEDQAERREPRRASPTATEPVASRVRPTLDREDADELAEQILQGCLEAVGELDAHGLEQQLERASVALSRVVVLQKVLVPLMHGIGDMWQEGSLRPAHEHLASSVVRSFVGSMRSSHPSSRAPGLIATTPARQHHELGALIAAAAAASDGWDVTYLGPDLPAEEIAAAAVQKGASAVALSVTYPPDDPLLPQELRRLSRLLGEEVELLVGGRSSGAYRGILEEIGARQVEAIPELRRVLERLRSERAAAPSSS